MKTNTPTERGIEIGNNIYKLLAEKGKTQSASAYVAAYSRIAIDRSGRVGGKGYKAERDSRPYRSRSRFKNYRTDIFP